MVAVGSCSQERARAFGDQFGIPHRHGSHAELVQDPYMHVISIATPASEHKENMRLCLNAGKTVDCVRRYLTDPAKAAVVVGLLLVRC